MAAIAEGSVTEKAGGRRRQVRRLVVLAALAVLVTLAAAASRGPAAVPALPGGAVRVFKASSFPQYLKAKQRVEEKAGDRQLHRSVFQRGAAVREATYQLLRTTLGDSVQIADQGAPCDLWLGGAAANVVVRSLSWHEGNGRFYVYFGPKEELKDRAGKSPAQRVFLAVATPDETLHLYEQGPRARSWSAPRGMTDPTAAFNDMEQRMLTKGYAVNYARKLAIGSLADLLGDAPGPKATRAEDLAARAFEGTPLAGASPQSCSHTFCTMVLELLTRGVSVTRRSVKADRVKYGFVAEGRMVCVRSCRLIYHAGSQRWRLHLAPIYPERFDEMTIAVWIPAALEIFSVPQHYRFGKKGDGCSLHLLGPSDDASLQEAWAAMRGQLAAAGCRHLATVELD